MTITMNYIQRHPGSLWYMVMGVWFVIVAFVPRDNWWWIYLVSLMIAISYICGEEAEELRTRKRMYLDVNKEELR